MTVQDLVGNIAIISDVGIIDGKYCRNPKAIDYDDFDIIDKAWRICTADFQHLKELGILEKEVQSIYYSKVEKGDVFDGILVSYRY